MIELGKQYRTRDGREVRVYAVDASASYPIHGAIKHLDLPIWLMADWTPEGLARDFCGGPGGLCESDLIEVKPRITRPYWLVFYGDRLGGPMHAWGEDPKSFLDPHNVIAVTGPHEITFTEGEGISE